MEFKAIALDMDGTLLNEENTIDADLAAFLQNIRAQGVKLFLASGRSGIEIEAALPEGFAYDGMVSANGMGVYRGEEKLVQHTIDPAIIKEAIRRVREVGMYYEIHPLIEERFALVEDKDMLAAEVSGDKPASLQDNEWNSRLASFSEVIQWKEELTTEDIIKVYFFSQNKAHVEQWIEVLDALKEEYSFSTSSSSAHNVEIMVGGIDKGTGIQLLLDAYGIDGDDMLAVGDAENDLPMFDIAGLAVAMENAQHFVKAEADEMTDLPYNEGGLLDYLEQHFD